MQQIDAEQGRSPIKGSCIPVADHQVLPAKLIILETGCGKPRYESRQRSTPVSPEPLPEMPGAGKPVRSTVTTVKVHQISPLRKARPHSVPVSRRASTSYTFIERDIPLYLVPHIIARAIWQRGERMYRISVIRTKQHYYTIRLRTARPVARTKKEVPAQRGSAGT
ncbi:MAG: hypothetical protein WC620_02535 [Methanoregula sp.]|jgi:hypothetical protein